MTGDYLALRREVGAVALTRDVIRAWGDDTDTFLQGQLSQDVAALAVGTSAWSLLLEPQGKVVAWLRLSRLGPNEVVIDVDGGFAETVLTRLNRFKLRTKCEFEVLADWRVVALRGPGMAAVDTSSAAVVADAAWPGLAGVDLLGPDVVVPPGVRECGLDAYETVRIEVGVPTMGAESLEGIIPAEAGIVDRSVSFTKGCYTGQELVARVDSRGGNTPRHLRGVLVTTNVVPPVGAAVHDADDKLVGHLTSVGESLDRRAPVALAFIHRTVEPPAAVTLRWEGSEAPARIEELPLL